MLSDDSETNKKYRLLVDPIKKPTLQFQIIFIKIINGISYWAKHLFTGFLPRYTYVVYLFRSKFSILIV